MRKSLRLPLLLVALATTVMTSLPADSLACPKIIEYEYFYDAAKTQHAGYCTRVCNGSMNCSGVQTQYYLVLSTEPCGCS